MQMLFTICAVWVCIMSAAVYSQTNSYGHLMISVGAALTLATYLFIDNSVLVELLLVAGDVLFWGGLAVVATFGRHLEKERFRTSTWQEIFLGKVPEHLQTRKISPRIQVIQGLITALLFAAIFYFGGRQQEALSFVTIAIVYAAYLGSLGVK